MAETVVELDHVSKAFRTVTALDDLSARAERGQVTVLLGPNGAGKTTALRVITGALPPDTGSVRAFGLDPAIDGETVRSRCGVVPATPEFYDRLTGGENLNFAAAVYSLDDPPITAAAERFGIVDALPLPVGGYSTGMKARLALARAILNDPELLLLDEPTSGLDPESAHAVLGLIDEMADEGKTVVMSTHLLLEAEGLADHVVVMERGHDLVSGAPAELVQRYWPVASVLFDAEDRAALKDLESLPGVLSIEANGGPVTAAVDDLQRVPELITALAARGARLTRVVPHEPTLEELYFTVRRDAHKGQT